MDNKEYKKKDIKRSQKPMPNNYEAEQYVIGSIMVDNSIGQEVIAQLAEDDFYSAAHRKIYEHIKLMVHTGKPTDVVTVSDSLDKVGELENIGGVNYLFDLYNMIPSTANFNNFLDIVKRDGALRKLIIACADITDNACGSTDILTSMALAEKKIFELTFTQEIKDLAHVSDGVNNVLKETEELMRSPNRIRGIESGFKNLDDLIHGYREGQMIVLAARPGCGKTSFAMNIATNISLEHPEKVVAIFNLEMSLTELTQRMLYSVSGVTQEMVFKGEDTSVFDKLWSAKQRLDKTKIYIDDTAAATPDKIASKLRRLKQKQKRLDLVIIDYLQLLRLEKSLSSLQQEVTEISRAIKVMAKELKVPILILSQTSRGLERRDDKTPMLSDLRDSGAIEQDADQVYFLTKDDGDMGLEYEVVKLHVVKNRSGSTGVLPFKWEGNLVKFSDMDRITYEQIKESAKLKNKDESDDSDSAKKAKQGANSKRAKDIPPSADGVQNVSTSSDARIENQAPIIIKDGVQPMEYRVIPDSTNYITAEVLYSTNSSAREPSGEVTTNSIDEPNAAIIGGGADKTTDSADNIAGISLLTQDLSDLVTHGVLGNNEEE